MMNRASNVKFEQFSLLDTLYKLSKTKTIGFIGGLCLLVSDSFFSMNCFIIISHPSIHTFPLNNPIYTPYFSRLFYDKDKCNDRAFNSLYCSNISTIWLACRCPSLHLFHSHFDAFNSLYRSVNAINSC